MSELMLQWVATLKMLVVCLYASLYGFGGMNGKWKRRIIGALLLTVAIIGFSLWTGTFSWWYLLCAPLYYGSTSIGYGGTDVTWKKIFKRSYCGLAYVCASLPIAIVNEAWALLALHTVLCIGTSVLLGVWNPTNARNEETLIGVSISLLPLYMI